MTEEISYTEFAPSLLTALVRKCTHNPFPLLITLLLLRHRSSYKNYVWWLAILVSAQIFFHFLRSLSYTTLISATDSYTWMSFAFASSPYEFIYLFDIVFFFHHHFTLSPSQWTYLKQRSLSSVYAATKIAHPFGRPSILSALVVGSTSWSRSW